MILVNNNGVTFAAETKPLDDWQGQDVPYVLWFEPQRLSCNLRYVMPVRVLVDYIKDGQKLLALAVKLGDSKTFSLIAEQNIIGNFNEFETSDYMEILAWRDNLDDSYKRLSFPLYGESGEIEKILFTFYVTACHDAEETVLKNIIIAEARGDDGVITDNALIRVGGVFYDESQELKINAANMGLKLPADICKAFWNCGWDEYYPDRAECRDKLKELLLNYMGIRGECGSYSSAEKSLKWFGWGDKVTLTQLMRINATVPELYMNRSFDLAVDPVKVFKKFRRSTFLSLKSELKALYGIGPELRVTATEGTWKNLWNEKPSSEIESEDAPVWTWNKEIFSENERFIGKVNSNQDGPWGIGAMYDYAMNELALKLACLASLYEEYFLPIQLNVTSSSVNDRVSAAPLKLLCGTSSHTMANVDNITPYPLSVRFKKHAYYIRTEHDEAFIDVEFNVVSDYSPVSFLVCLSTFSGELVWKRWGGTEDETVRFSIPLSEIEVDPLNIHYLAVLIDGIWFQKIIYVRYPELKIIPGTLEYAYNPEKPWDICEPDLVTTYKLENFTDEKFLDTYWDEAAVSVIAEVANKSYYIPLAKRNIVLVSELVDSNNKPVVYKFIGVDALAASRYVTDPDGHVMVPETTSFTYAYHPGSLCPDLVCSCFNDETIPDASNVTYEEIGSGEYINGIPCEPNDLWVKAEVNPDDYINMWVDSLSIATEVQEKSKYNVNKHIYKRPVIIDGREFEYCVKIDGDITDPYVNLELPENVKCIKVYTDVEGSAQIFKSGTGYEELQGASCVYLPVDEDVQFQRDFQSVIWLYGIELLSDENQDEVWPGKIENFDCGFEADAFVMENVKYELHETLKKLYTWIDNLREGTKLDYHAMLTRFIAKYWRFDLEYPTRKFDVQELVALVRQASVYGLKYLATLTNDDSDYIVVEKFDVNGQDGLKLADTDLWVVVEKIQKLIEPEIKLIEKEGNAKAPYYVYAISRYPIYQLPVDTLVSLGIDSLKEDSLEAWARQKHDFGFSMKNATLSKKIRPMLRWFPERFKFEPAKTDNDGWTRNEFYKDDIVCCRVEDQFAKIPYLALKNSRFTFSPSSPGMPLKKNEKDLSIETAVAVLPRISTLVPTLYPGYYDVEFAYAWGPYDNLLHKKSGVLRILDLINSRFHIDSL